VAGIGSAEGSDDDQCLLWKDAQHEVDGDGEGTAMMRGIGTDYQLACKGWVHVKSDRGTVRGFVKGRLSLTDGVIGDGRFEIEGESGSFEDHLGKDVTVEVENPKRYTIPG
jgi:hypothetical protein